MSVTSRRAPSSPRLPRLDLSRLGLPRLGRIETYVLIQQLRSLGVALAVIAALVMLIDFVEVSRGVGSDQDLSALRIMGLVALKSPSVIVQLLPFVFLFGTLAAYIGLNRRSELIAMRAAGRTNRQADTPAARISGSAPGAGSDRAIWLREGDDQRQMIIRAGRQDRANARLLDVTFFIYTTDAAGSRDFSERIDARSAALSAGRWRLTDAVGASVGQRAVTYSSLDLLSSLADEEAFERFARPQSTPFWSLPNQIQRIENAGFASTAYRLRFQQLLVTPLVFAAMSILAAAFSLRLMRLGDLAKMSVAAVVLGFAFFFLNQFSAAMGSAEVVPPFVSAWLPPILTALAAFTLLFYTEDG